ncbi:MAG TPA: hypothetical protein VK644_12955 [Chitinophagaceae bacterium]|nr:hypothetical protein [Chitinophagaceae bacterium]
MLQKLFNSFDPDKETDPRFGEVEIHFNEPDSSYYLMKDVLLDETHLSLTIESKKKESTPQQFELYNRIITGFTDVLKAAYSFMAKQSPDGVSTDPCSKYQPESIYIGDLGNFHANWELSFLNIEDGLTYSIVEFDGTTPVAVSIEE